MLPHSHRYEVVENLRNDLLFVLSTWKSHIVCVKHMLRCFPVYGLTVCIFREVIFRYSQQLNEFQVRVQQSTSALRVIVRDASTELFSGTVNADQQREQLVIFINFRLRNPTT